jgi:transposase
VDPPPEPGRGEKLLSSVPLGKAYAIHVESVRDLIEVYSREIAMLDDRIAGLLSNHGGYRAIQAIPGVGPILAAVFVAEVGDVTRFVDARHLASWAGLTPRHRESDTKVHRGQITKQGSRLLRWAAIEAVARGRSSSVISEHLVNVGARRGVHVARVAAARKVLTLVFYGLRDGEIRCLAEQAG